MFISLIGRAIAAFVASIINRALCVTAGFACAMHRMGQVSSHKIAFRRLQKQVSSKSRWIVVSLGLALLPQGAAMAQSQSVEVTYTPVGLPETIDWTMGGGTHYDYPFTVTDEFAISDVSVEIEVFEPLISFVDFFLIAPDGTQVDIMDYACDAAPISLGQRVYDIPNAAAGQIPQGIKDGGIPATYTFADGGDVIGQSPSGQTSPGTACHQYWGDVETRPEPTWPTTPANHNDNWPETGAFIELPPGNTYAPHSGEFSDFDDLPSNGTWILRIRDWRFPSDDVSPWLQMDTKLVSAAVTLSGTKTPPVFTVATTQNMIDQGDTTTLTFTVDNSSVGFQADGLQFSSTLPTGFEFTTPVSSTDSCNGTLSLDTDAQTISYADGQVDASSICEISVEVLATGYGEQTFVTSELQSNSGTATPNSEIGATGDATVTVTAQDVPEFSLVFDPDSIEQGASSGLTYTISNASDALPVEDLGFTHTFATGLVIDGSGTIENTCGGTLTAVEGTGYLELAGGSTAVSETCEISLRVTSDAVGTYAETTSALSSNFGSGSSASATLEVIASNAPIFSKQFSVQQISQGATTILTYMVDNSRSLVEVTDLAFTETFPTGLLVDGSITAQNSCNGTLTAVDGTNQVILTEGSVVAGASCTIAISIEGVAGGTYQTQSGSLTSSLGDSEPASATLDVSIAATPGFSKAFAETSIAQGATTILTYTIDNSGSLVEVSDLAFTDTLPTGLKVDASVAPENSCEGTLTATGDSVDISLQGGTIAAGESCDIEISILSEAAGDFVSESDALISSLGNSGTASASLSVSGAAPLTFTKAFDPIEIGEGLTTTLTYVIDNQANLVDATGITFSETFPSALIIGAADTVTSDCAGTLTAAEDATQIKLENGAVSAGELCSISIGLSSSTPGSYDLPVTALSSNLGASETAAATLTVLDITPPQVEISSETESFTDLSAIAVTFTFSEAVTGFELTDIVVGSGVAADFETVSQTVYTANVTPSGQGDLTVDVPAGAASDVSSQSNGNLEAEQLVIKNGIVELTQRAIRNFVSARMDTIVSNEPDLFERLTRRPSASTTGTSGFAIDHTSGNSNLSFNTSLAGLKASFRAKPQFQYQSSIMRKTGLFGHADDTAKESAEPKFDIWTKGTYSYSRNDTRRARSGLLYLGADWMVDEDLIFGVLTQVDWTEEEDEASALDIGGVGWLAGPYAIKRLTDTLILDGRVAVGKSSNQINPIGLYEDDFDTDRVLVSSQLTGDFDWDAFTINPFFRAIYMEERQNDYTDTLGNHIGEQTMALGRVNFGPKIRTVIETENGTIFTPYVTLAGLYDFEGARQTDLDGFVIDESRLRGRFTGGMDLLSSNGWNLSSEAFLDGIGQEDIEAYGLSFNLALEF
jgi:hypothetical protein